MAEQEVFSFEGEYGRFINRTALEHGQALGELVLTLGPEAIDAVHALMHRFNAYVDEIGKAAEVLGVDEAEACELGAMGVVLVFNQLALTIGVCADAGRFRHWPRFKIMHVEPR